jgi:glycosyltransferase involved in cell wall biosynthesis
MHATIDSIVPTRIERLSQSPGSHRVTGAAGPDLSVLKVALVHDALNQYGGAERVLEHLHEIFPSAPIFVPIYDRNVYPENYDYWDIRVSWMRRIPGANRFHRAFFPLYPFAFQSFDLSEFDVVVSSSFNFAHNVLTGAGTCHICYCHSPPRFLWDYFNYARQERLGGAKRLFASALLPGFRAWDIAAANRVDCWISASRTVQMRISKVYRRRSVVICPPVNVRAFAYNKPTGDYYLLLMRLVGWKRAEIAIEACSKLGLNLLVAGDGRDAGHLKAIAGPTVTFVGRVSDSQKKPLYEHCKALILTSVEDFGITPLEAMAAGRPVIAFRGGGALDTIVEGKTGTFFDEQTSESLASVLQRFDPERYDSTTIRAHAEKFDSEQFKKKILVFVQEKLRAFRLRSNDIEGHAHLDGSSDHRSRHDPRWHVGADRIASRQ